jgi:hypothetical protein
MSDTDKLPENGIFTPSKRGGAREGAGRKVVYSLLEKMAIFLRVTEIQDLHNCTASTAIKILQDNGELPLHGASNLQRYITPKHLSEEIRKALRDAPSHNGIISLIPQPKTDRSENSEK